MIREKSCSVKKFHDNFVFVYFIYFKCNIEVYNFLINHIYLELSSTYIFVVKAFKLGNAINIFFN